jgi:hypothetical protein
VLLGEILINPLEIIERARRRLARLALVRLLLQAALPLTVTVTIAGGFNLINEFSFDRFGFLMEPARARLFLVSLLALTLFELGALALIARRAWSHAGDWVRAAELIDRAVGARQEILSLASLSVPESAETANMRSVLFPLLKERAANYLAAFDPRAAFKLQVREPIVRSFILAMSAAAALIAAAFALMIRPTPVQLLTDRLQLLANTIAESAPGPAQQQLAAASRDVARDLLSPKLPPQEKLAELQALERELEKYQLQHPNSASGTGNSQGSGKGNGAGQGEGNSSGSGSGAGTGSGSGNSQNGSGKHGKDDQQTLELHNDIANAQMKLEQEAASGEQPNPKNNSSKVKGSAPSPGSNPNQPGGGNSQNGNKPIPQVQTMASAKMPSGESPGARRNDQGSMGDTHLGEFPKGGNYQRFYKLGEHGAAINIRDARYVTFQLPTEIQAGDAGSIVPDANRSRAMAPYTNAPLKAERLPASPDEQQLVPPRYRELIR